MSLIEDLTPEYRTLDDVLSSLGRLQQMFYTQRDRRAVFLTAYRIITQAVKDGVLAARFLDNDWVGRYDVAFANRYRAALLAFEKNDLAVVPQPWRVAFDAAQNNDGLVIQDLLMGINAHVNHDLPFALAAVSIDPGRDQRHQDHTAVNAVLAAATDQLEDRIEAMYAPGLDLLGRAFHPVVDDVSSFGLADTRQLAWDNAVALTDARSDEERAAIARRIDQHSGALARLILAPTGRKLVLDSLRRIESVSPWWRFIALPALDTSPGAPLAEQPLSANTFEELIARLNTIVERYDARRSRMSVDPAAFALFCARIRDAVAAGSFDDAAWITRLHLHLGSLYLNSVSAFDQGRLDEVPECWLMAFAMAANGENLLLQSLLAALNARLNYDLPLALLRSGVDASHRADFEKLHVIVRDHIIAVEDQVMRKYGNALLSPSLLAGPLQGIAAEFTFDRAHEAAWDNASTLAAAPTDTERRTLLLQLDRRAGAVAQRIVLRGLPGASWVILALRHLENEFGDAWSRWM